MIRWTKVFRDLWNNRSRTILVILSIAVGIFAGGVVFAVLLPEMRVGPLDSFWIGSLIVLVLTGLYTTLGGFRAVAYTETLQTVVLILGSALVTYYGLQAIGGLLGNQRPHERLRLVFGATDQQLAAGFGELRQ